MEAPELTDGVVLLSPIQLDEASVHLAGEDEEQVKWVSGGVGTLETAYAWIKRNLAAWESGGPIFNFGIRDAATRELLGMVEANQQAPGRAPGEVNISYGLYPQGRGRGLATRAVVLMTRFLEEKALGEKAIIAADERNSRSQQVAERAGFTPSRTVRNEKGELFVEFERSLSPGSSMLHI